MAIRIYIDQGHNPTNPNAGAEGNGYREQDIVYRVGLSLNAILAGDPAFLSRLSRPTPDTVLGVSNTDSLRVRVAGAVAFGADLFLSLHTNAAVQSTASGSEALVYTIPSVAASLGEDILYWLNRATGLENRGVIIRNRLYVLRKTRMPAVLVELGFITNYNDAMLMLNSPELFADGVYNGIINYLGL